MFEEVPRERRGLSRWVPVRRVVVGPFVLGGGMLLAALGGSVAVAAAATVLTASAIGADLPARPHPVVAPTMSHPVAPAPGGMHRAARPGSASAGATAGRSTPVPVPGGRIGPGTSATHGPSDGVAAPAPGSTAPVEPPAVSPVEPNGSAAPTGAAPTTAPSSSGPRGNAVIHLSGYDQATGRFAYQFATALPQAGGYVISGPRTFTAVLAPAATITSGGTLCPPAGSSCSPDQLIAAVDSGFFAEVAIDVTGALRSVLEVGDQAATAKLLPLPGTATTPPGRSTRHGVGAAQPTASPTAGS